MPAPRFRTPSEYHRIYAFQRSAFPLFDERNDLVRDIGDKCRGDLNTVQAFCASCAVTSLFYLINARSCSFVHNPMCDPQPLY